MSMQMPQREGRAGLVLTLGDDWAAGELGALLQATASIYGIRVLIQQARGHRGVSPLPPPLFRSPTKSIGYAAQTLRIRYITIASPGAIALDGLGEPLEQVRELIKDLWYRNKSERQMAELQRRKAQLEVLEEEIQILRKLGFTPEEIRRQLQRTRGDVRVLNQAIMEDKIALPTGENKDRTQ